MGCVPSTYQVEAEIINATGQAEPTCGPSASLNASECNLFATFLGKSLETPPMMKKREELPAAKKREAEAIAATFVRAYHPGVHFPGLDERVPPVSLKRDTGTQLLDNLEICSPLIALGISLLETEVTLPINITDVVGPCGVVCNDLLCGLNLLCADEGAALIETVRGYRV
jgi:hypothetical protein